MRLFFPILFLTLVLGPATSPCATESTSPPPTLESAPKKEFEKTKPPADETVRESLQWETQEPLSAQEQAEAFTANPFKRNVFNWSFRLGFLGGAVSEADQSEQIYYAGFRYDFYKRPMDTWQLEVTTGKDNFLHISAGKKWHFPLEETTLPYYRLAVGDIIDSSEGLGSIFNIKKIQGIAAIGLDDLFLMDQRLQLESAVAFALIGPQFEISVGLAF